MTLFWFFTGAAVLSFAANAVLKSVQRSLYDAYHIGHADGYEAGYADGLGEALDSADVVCRQAWRASQWERN